MFELLSEQMAAWLRQAKEAHTAYEATLDAPDENWPEWYADFIIAGMLKSAKRNSNKQPSV